MNWFENIEENTLVRVELNNGKKIEIYFIKVSNGIVEGKLRNGKIKKFKEDKVEDLEEIDINIDDELIRNATVSVESQQMIQNIIQKQKDSSTSQQVKVPSIKTSFINKIDNLVLSPVEFKGKEDLFELKKESMQIYSNIMNILNQFNHAKKIKELDFKFSRSQKIIKQLDILLAENYYEEIDKFLAYILQEVDISYFEFFKKLPEYIYCLKHDIYFFNIKNNKYGFVVAEKLFELYDLDNDIEAEWFYLIKNILNFNSFKTLEYQYDFGNELSEHYQNLFAESIDYIFIKSKINNFPDLMTKQIEVLKNTLKITNEYQNLNYINEKIEQSISSKQIIPSFQNNTFSSMGDSVLQMMQPTIDEELKNILPASGVIKTFFKDRNYGFIEDKRGMTNHFSISNIIDTSLLKELKKDTNPNRYIEVCFSTSYNYKGEVADAIQKPKQIKIILEEVLKYKKNRHFNIAQKVLEQILLHYPDNLKVQQVYSDIMRTKPSNKSFNSKKYENYGSYGNYRKAKDAKDRKDYDTAIKYFKLALENNEKLESTIKDLALTYYESGDIDSSKNLLLDYENQLEKNVTTYNFLENHYSALGLYEKSIEYVDLLLERTENLNKEVILLAKKATCHVKLNHQSQAKKILEDILMLQKNNSYAKKLLEEIKTGNFSNIDIDISSFGGGLSKFMEETLSSYEDYSGVASKIKGSDKLFTKGTLRALQEFIRTTKARPKERANSLLSEAKLIQVLEPDNELYLKTILKRYCDDMALNHMADYSPMEVIRFFYTEGSSLEIEWKRLVPQVVFYFKTYSSNYNELINTQMPSLDEKALDDVLYNLFTDGNNRIWNNILDMFIWNETITKHISKRIYENKKSKRLSFDFFNTLKIETNGNNNFDNYIGIWNQAREKRRREYQQWFNLIKSIIQIDNLEHLVSQISENLKEFEKIWLTPTDGRVLNTISEINKNLEDYLIQKTFDDKERTKTYILTEINELLNDIKKLPTKFSYEGYKPLLEKIEKLLNQSFLNILKVSTPEIDIQLLGESVVVDKNTITLQLLITNSKDSSPISNASIEIMKTNDIKFLGGETQIYESIRGGAEKIIKLDIKVSDNVINDLVTDIGIILNYNIRAMDETTEKIFQIPIRLYTSDKFEKIKNVYAPLSEGGAVTDKSMFYGRDEYIDNIVNSLITSNSKSIIIYGQKRSGKSSVLYHLKNHLLEKENAFCIDFSMGEIIENLSSTKFYNKILNKIEEELESLEAEGYDIPNFSKPSILELKESPADIFNESLRKFNKSLSSLDKWKNKKLVILIDEFTYVYTSIEKNELNSNFMKSWKAFIEKNYFSAVLIGQDVAPKFKQKYPNEFGVTEDKRLTYLSENDARELIEKPIKDKERDSSRYIGKAVDKIIDYTACSPYYLQMFCARVVDYMNRKKAISVTESDIEEIANSFIEGTECLSKDKFDNLFTAGDADIETFNLDDIESILIQIAKKTNIGSCSRDDILIENKAKEVINDILEDLKRREVIEQKSNFYQIKVGLFKKWLLKQ